MKTDGKILLVIMILMCIFLISPYALNSLILPGQYQFNSKYFNGEWFNHVESSSIASYEKLNRWAHYYGKHGCEPEPNNCTYNGVLGQYRLLFDFIQESEAFPVDLFEQ
ncbi:MAG: hypothetical protein CVU90_10125 [Firmicutes bacterium HGW-Firmicutes-15]|nr:MAG: hypothetical protein CVU90_10125 [Firmicutes bacterium HGW-Firmicutes-15]